VEKRIGEKAFSREHDYQRQRGRPKSPGAKLSIVRKGGSAFRGNLSISCEDSRKFFLTLIRGEEGSLVSIHASFGRGEEV